MAPVGSWYHACDLSHLGPGAATGPSAPQSRTPRCPIVAPRFCVPSQPHEAYFYIAVAHGHEAEVDSALRRKFTAEILDIVHVPDVKGKGTQFYPIKKRFDDPSEPPMALLCVGNNSVIFAPYLKHDFQCSLARVSWLRCVLFCW